MTLNVRCLHLCAAGGDEETHHVPTVGVYGGSGLMSCESSLLANFPSWLWLQVKEEGIYIQLVMELIYVYMRPG